MACFQHSRNSTYLRVQNARGLDSWRCEHLPGEEAQRYPPDSRGDRLAQLLAKQCIDGASQSESARPALLCECSCNDFDAISRRLLALEREQRLLLQQHSKMERVIRELLQGMQTSDDIALLERLTCQAVVYNVELTSHRDLRLLRSALLKIIGKFSLS